MLSALQRCLCPRLDPHGILAAKSDRRRPPPTRDTMASRELRIQPQWLSVPAKRMKKALVSYIRYVADTLLIPRPTAFSVRLLRVSPFVFCLLTLVLFFAPFHPSHLKPAVRYLLVYANRDLADRRRSLTKHAACAYLRAVMHLPCKMHRDSI